MAATPVGLMSDEADEVAWLQNQFDASKHVAKGTYVKLQVRMRRARPTAGRHS